MSWLVDDPREVCRRKERADKLARGELTMHVFGNQVTWRLTRGEMTEYEQAKERRYLDTRSAVLGNVYYEWCQATRWPFIAVKRAKVFAQIRLDVETCCEPRFVSEYGKARLSGFAWGATDASTQVSGGIWMYLQRVRIERADQVAQKLVGFAKRIRKEALLSMARERLEEQGGEVPGRGGGDAMKARSTINPRAYLERRGTVQSLYGELLQVQSRSAGTTTRACPGRRCSACSTSSSRTAGRCRSIRRRTAWWTT